MSRVGDSSLRMILIGASMLMLSMLCPPTQAESDHEDWFRAAPMQMPTDDFGMVVIDGLIYAVGGQTGPEPLYVDDLQVYNPASDEWQMLPPMPSADGAVRAASIGSTIYVLTFAGDLYAFDTHSQEWSHASSSADRVLVPDIVAYEGLIYVFGGFVMNGESGGDATNAVFVFDPQRERWSTRSPMPTSRNHHRAVVVDDLIYVLGGSDGENALASMDIYDPRTDEWSSAPSMPAEMENFGAVLWKDQIHALIHGHHYIYDIEAGHWSDAPPMITSRHGFGAAVVDDHLYVIGGCYEDPRFNTPDNEVYVLGSATSERTEPGAAAVAFLIVGFAVASMIISLLWKGAFDGRSANTFE